jgi:predicted nucleotidyltransferase
LAKNTATKPIKHAENKRIVYTKNHWTKLTTLREKAIPIMESLEKFHLKTIVHGSIARGDVKAGSDIDIFLPEVQSSFQIETALQQYDISANTRFIVQATPNYAMKAHIEIDELTTISFPLMQMRRVEKEFYRFGGEISLNQLKEKMRMPGVDKRLMLIEPTIDGHYESSIIGREEFAATILKVSSQTVLDRVHTIIRREAVGRTGVFVKRELLPEETFELALKKISEANPAVRRRMKKKN